MEPPSHSPSPVIEKPLLRRIQVTLLAGAAVFLIWGWVLRTAVPEAWDSWTLRVLLSFFTLLTLAASVVVPSSRKALVPAFNTLLFGASFFLWLQLYFNHFSYFYCAIFTVSSTALTVTALSFRGALALATFQSALVLAGPLVGATVEPKYLAFSFVTIVALWLPPLMQYSTDRALRMLLKAGQEFSTIVGSFHEGLVLQDREGRVAYFNEIAPRLLGVTSDQLAAGTLTDPQWRALREDGQPLSGEEHPATTVIRTGEPQKNVVIGMHRPDGGLRWFRISAVPVVQEMYAIVRSRKEHSFNGGVLTVFADITEEREKEKALETTRARMKDSARLLSLGEAAAGIAHEINNPLAIIQLRLDALIEDAEGVAPFLLENIKVVHASAERIAKLVKSVKGLSRNSADDPKTLRNVLEMVTEVVHVYTERLKHESVQLRLEVDPGLSLLCRPSQIGQVLANLVHNSLDAIVEANGGSGVAGVAQHWISVTGRSLAGGGMELIVEDSGPGIPEIIRKKVLEPFFTTKPEGKGTGLGLSISNSIIQAHLGVFEIDGSAKGARFRMEFPATVIARLEAAA